MDSLGHDGNGEPFGFLVSSPAAWPDAGIVTAAATCAATGILNLEYAQETPAGGSG